MAYLLYLADVTYLSAMKFLSLLLYIPLFHVCIQEDILQNIRQKYAAINANIKTYSMVEMDPPESSAEGGSLTGYFAKDTVKLIVEMYYGETGKKRTESYFDKGRIIFIHSTLHHYNNPPITSPDFDPADSWIEEERFYFDKDKMVRWIDTGKNIIRIKDPAFINKEKILLKYAAEMKKMVIEGRR